MGMGFKAVSEMDCCKSTWTGGFWSRCRIGGWKKVAKESIWVGR